MVKIIKLLRELKFYHVQIFSFLTALKKLHDVAGTQVAKQIADDMEVISNNWIQYLQDTRNVKP